MMFFKMALLSAAAAQKNTAADCQEQTLTSMTVPKTKHNTVWQKQQLSTLVCKTDYTLDIANVEAIKCQNGRFGIKRQNQKGAVLDDKTSPCKKDSKPCKDDTVTNGTVKKQKALHLDTELVFTTTSSTKLDDVLTCSTGYERAAAVTKITCKGNGVWDYPVNKEFVCEKKKAVTTPKTTTPKPTPVTECPDLPVANGKLLKQTPPTAAKKEYTLTDNTILKCNATFERKITKVTCDGATGTWFNGTNKIAKNAKDLCKKKNKKSGALLVGTAAAAVLLL